jgi:hypothetical protein
MTLQFLLICTHWMQTGTTAGCEWGWEVSQLPNFPDVDDSPASSETEPGEGATQLFFSMLFRGK